MLIPLALSLALAQAASNPSAAQDSRSGAEAPAEPVESQPVRALLRVPPGALTLETSRALALDVAGVTRTGEVELVADADDRAALARAGVPFTVVHEDLSAFYASRMSAGAELRGGALGAWLSPPFGSGGMGGNYTYAQIVSVLDQIHAAYPTLTTAKFSIGTSLQGRDLWAIKISDNPDVDESEPEVRFDALHHAREPQSMQSTLWFVLSLLERYGSDALSTYLVDEREIWYVPCVNPDGYVFNQSTNPGGGGLWRKNRRANAGGSTGVDLNRNYSFQWGFDNDGSSPLGSAEDYRGTAPVSEPEIAAMQAFIASRNFAVSITAHTYSDLWLWPWGYIAAAPANNADYTELGDLCTLETDWIRGPAGAVLYLANGVTDDYDHATKGTMAFTPEIGNDIDGFWPATARIVPLAETTEPGFQRAAWAAGAYVHQSGVTVSELGDGDGFIEAGESASLVLSLRNSGRAGSGPVDLGLATSTAGVTVTTGLVGLASIGSFSSGSNAAQPLELAIGAGVAAGTRVDYVATITYQGFTQEIPGSFKVGRPRRFLSDDLEKNLGWTIGAPGDGATTGIWAYGDPVGTDNGGPASNPEDDASPAPGVRCFTTGNGSTTVGGDDVDGGPTTLISPRFDLSGVGGATLHYQRWFANFTTLNDALEVAVSDDDGSTWTTLETVTGGNHNQWTPVQFDVQDHVSLTNKVRLRFRTGDQPNDSLTEAAVDEIWLETYDAGPRLNYYGKPQIGSELAMHIAAAPGQGWALRASPNPAHIVTPYGTILIQVASSFTLLSGTTPASGLARFVAVIPNRPNLIGQTFHTQVFALGPRQYSNRATITFQ